MIDWWRTRQYLPPGTVEWWIIGQRVVSSHRIHPKRQRIAVREKSAGQTRQSHRPIRVSLVFFPLAEIFRKVLAPPGAAQILGNRVVQEYQRKFSSGSLKPQYMYPIPTSSVGNLVIIWSITFELDIRLVSPSPSASYLRTSERFCQHQL